MTGARMSYQTHGRISLDSYSIYILEKTLTNQFRLMCVLCKLFSDDHMSCCHIFFND